MKKEDNLKSQNHLESLPEGTAFDNNSKNNNSRNNNQDKNVGHGSFAEFVKNGVCQTVSKFTYENGQFKLFH